MLVAKPIHNIEQIKTTPEQERSQNVSELLSVLAENKEALVTLLDVIDKLHDKGVLDLLVGLVGQGDKVTAIAAREMNKPGISNSLDHLMNLAEMAGRIDVHKLKGLSEQINKGMEQAEASLDTDNKISMFDLVKALKDPDINRSVKVGLNFLKGASQPEE